MPCWRPLASCRRCVRWSVIPCGAAALLAAQMGLRSEALVTVSAPSRILEQLRLFARFVGLPALARSHFIRLVERQAGISAACLDVARYRLEMPGLVVHADDDTRVAVENAERIHAAWPASRLLRLPGGGHHRLLGERRLSESLLALLEERPAMRACRRVERRRALPEARSRGVVVVLASVLR